MNRNYIIITCLVKLGLIYELNLKNFLKLSIEPNLKDNVLPTLS
jgi:hypothetical protein